MCLFHHLCTHDADGELFQQCSSRFNFYTQHITKRQSIGRQCRERIVEENLNQRKQFVIGNKVNLFNIWLELFCKQRANVEILHLVYIRDLLDCVKKRNTEARGMTNSSKSNPNNSAQNADEQNTNQNETAQMDYMTSLSHLRCRLDIMDMTPQMTAQQQLDADYKHILIYQDDATKFTCLKPLRSDNASAISGAVIDIFCELGSTLIISTRRHGFSAAVTQEIRRQWPGCFVVVGRTVSDNELSRFETCRDRVKQAMTHWMDEQRNATWSTGIRFVQWELNTSSNQNNSDRSQVNMLNERAMLGLSSQLNSNIAACLDTEEDLVNAMIAQTT